MLSFGGFLDKMDAPESLRESRSRSDADIAEKIRNRTNRIAFLFESTHLLNPLAQKFILRMSLLSNKKDPISGRTGAGLAFLTNQQMSYLEGLEDFVQNPKPEPYSRSERCSRPLAN